MKIYKVEIFIPAECESDAIERIESIDIDDEIEAFGEISEFEDTKFPCGCIVRKYWNGVVGAIKFCKRCRHIDERKIKGSEK